MFCTKKAKVLRRFTTKGDYMGTHVIEVCEFLNTNLHMRRSSSQRNSEPAPKKAKMIQSAGKVMASGF